YLYTSGTTGKPKCVPISRGQIIAATESTQKSLPFGQNDQWLLTIPLNHIGGISIVTRSLLSGSSIRLIDKFEKNVVTDILHNENQVTFCSLVPTQLHKLLQNSGFRVHSEFKGILLGGGPIP